MKLRILIPIKYKSTQKKDLAKLKQCYGSKIVHLLQDNEITESSPKVLKDAKTWELPGLRPLDPRQGLCLWTPPRALRWAPGPHPWVLALRARWAPFKHFAPGATSTSYATAPPVQAGAHNQSFLSTGARKLPWFFLASPSWRASSDSGNMDMWFKNQFPVHTDQIQVTWTSK